MIHRCAVSPHPSDISHLKKNTPKHQNDYGDMTKAALYPTVKAASEREQCQTCLSIAEPMEQREPCELAQTWPSRDRGGRSQCEQARPQVKHLRDAIIYLMKETDRLNEVRTANATPIAHVAFDLRGRDGKQVGVQHFQVPAGHADKLIEALTGIYAAEAGDLKRRLTNLEPYNEKD